MKQIFSIALVALLLASCGNKNQDLGLTTISDYAPLTIGKYITYSVDSLLFTNFGTTETHVLYEAKYLVADTFVDNIGRKNFKIIRYIRKNPTESFVSEYTFSAINTGNNYEFVENNQRFLKLTIPIKNAYVWKGNTYINLSTPIGFGNMNSSYLDDWDYTYEDVDGPMPIPLAGFTLSNTVTVNQRNMSLNLPVTGSTNIASKDFAKEIYAKNIGLVYRQLIHWEYQLSSKYIGFGITMKMIDKN